MTQAHCYVEIDASKYTATMSLAILFDSRKERRSRDADWPHRVQFHGGVQGGRSGHAQASTHTGTDDDLRDARGLGLPVFPTPEKVTIKD